MNDPFTQARPRILVVCTGNLCRSPLAAALLRRALARRGIDADVASAGTSAPPDSAPDRRLLRVAGELGLDLSEHRSRPLTMDDLRKSHMVVVMTAEHAADLASLDPDVAERTVPLRTAAWRATALRGRALPFTEWAYLLAAKDPDQPMGDRTQDVDDPIGGPLRGYREMAAEVEHLVEQLTDAWSGA